MFVKSNIDTLQIYFYVSVVQARLPLICRQYVKITYAHFIQVLKKSLA